jgi:FAD/FMN-containing dehydrogenase/Fe-S oxidoreductase
MAAEARPGPILHRRSASVIDADALEAELKSRVRGQVRFDRGSRALYATDASNYRQVPIGVVVPRDADDVSAAVAVCAERRAPILARGGGTSLAGQCCNAAVVLDFSRHMDRVLEIDPERRVARVEPGVVLDDLRSAAERHHLTFGPDPATHSRCTLGGMIGNNSCGVHSVMAGRTADNVQELSILTSDGHRLRVGPTEEPALEQICAGTGRGAEIHRALRGIRERHADEIRRRYPDIPRRVSGFNLDELLPERGFHVARALVGSEGTCAIVLEATLHLVESPRHRALLVLGYPDVCAAADAVPDLMRRSPIGLEAIDDRLIGCMRRKGLRTRDVALLPEGGGWLLVEFGAESAREAESLARRAAGARGRGMSSRVFAEPEVQHRIWRIRESGLGATANVPGLNDTWPGWEDAAVPPERLGDYLRDFRRLLDRYGYGCSLYGHFGQGCVHVRIDFDLTTREGIDRGMAFIGDAADVVLRYGGSLSGEHGDGQARAAFLERMFGSGLVTAMREFKAAFDPAGLMNPGKVVDAFRPDENLRLGAAYAPWSPPTRFAYRGDHGSFPRAALRCVGIGECRRTSGGTMCPSWRATREEEHSTRGRARLLFELLQRDVIGRDGWREKSVKEALDLCLACKGCKSDCPVAVDMATYKAEFLSHYYARRLRPRSAYAFGLVYWWSRAAARAPRLANALSQAPVLRDVAALAAGMARQRRIPVFAREPFTTWHRRRGGAGGAGPEVLLWPDTFNNHFHPGTARAALEVMAAAGAHVRLPPRPLCCGRPLYDYGMLDLAKRQLRQVLSALRHEIRSGVPVVVLEPSCAAVFRDEMKDLLPDDADAARLAGNVLLFSEWVERHAPDGLLRPLGRDALVQVHCHHKSVLGRDAHDALLERLGLDVAEPEEGCCGMAGAFGFEAGRRHEVSVLCGERALLPAARAAGPRTLVVADGFSCREQIAQGSGRAALHVAEVARMALRPARGGAAD